MKSAVKEIVVFVRFVSRNFPKFYGVIVLALLVLCLEYTATSLMIPLSGAENPTVVRTWNEIIVLFNLQPTFNIWLWLFLVVMIVRLIFGYLQTILTTQLGKQVHHHLSGKIFKHVVSHELLTIIYTRPIGNYITLAGDDTFRCGTIVSTLLQSFVALFSSIVALFVLYQFSSQVFFALIIFLAVTSLLLIIILRFLIQKNIHANLLSRELGTSFIEALNSIRSIRALRGEQFVVQSYSNQIAKYVKMLTAMEAMRSGIKILPAILLLTLVAILIRPGSYLDFTESSLLAIMVIVIRIFSSLGQLVSSGSLLMTDIRAIQDIDSLLSNFDSNKINKINKINGKESIDSIALRGVSFAYHPNKPVMCRLEFIFRRGRTYAIIGPSGSGKSTLADIILGLIEPDHGIVEVNLGRLTLNDVRNQIVLVEQQPKIFSATLRENILFGAIVDDEKLWRVLEAVDLYDFVIQLPQGLDTKMNYLGENFSGGQRQRIGIARAMIRNPDVLLLDEGTSALDPPTRYLVAKNLQALMKNGIIIFITHDKEIALLADEILNVENSKNLIF